MLRQEELQKIYDDLASATTAYQEASTKFLNAKNDIEILRAAKTATGEIQGKNADEREAKAREIMAVTYAELKVIETNERACKLVFDMAQQRLDYAKQSMRLEELIIRQSEAGK